MVDLLDCIAKIFYVTTMLIEAPMMYIYIYIPRTSSCAKLSLEVETTLFFAVWDMFCSFPKIAPFHGWGFGC